MQMARKIPADMSETPKMTQMHHTHLVDTQDCAQRSWWHLETSWTHQECARMYTASKLAWKWLQKQQKMSAYPHYQTVNPNYPYVSTQLSYGRRMMHRQCCVSWKEHMYVVPCYQVGAIGRKERVCGHIGVIRMAGISGWANEPPADSCHNVRAHPGSSVAWTISAYRICSQTHGGTHKPFACTVVMWCSSPWQASTRGIKKPNENSLKSSSKLKYGLGCQSVEGLGKILVWWHGPGVQSPPYLPTSATMHLYLLPPPFLLFDASTLIYSPSLR